MEFADRLFSSELNRRGITSIVRGSSFSWHCKILGRDICLRNAECILRSFHGCSSCFLSVCSRSTTRFIVRAISPWTRASEARRSFFLVRVYTLVPFFDERHGIFLDFERENYLGRDMTQWNHPERGNDSYPQPTEYLFRHGPTLPNASTSNLFVRYVHKIEKISTLKKKWNANQPYLKFYLLLAGIFKIPI